MSFKPNYKIIVALIIGLFFVLNSFWVILDKQTPIIGDDARFLQATADLAEPVKQLNFSEFWSRWQTMFTKDTASFPRTPLFSLLSLPTFLMFGPNEDAAIITNLLVLALNSLLLFKLSEIMFSETQSKQKAQQIGILSVLVFNLMSGIYGFGRLYMSEMLQIFFVLLISLVIFKYKTDARGRIPLLLGVLLALAFLTRFIIFFYLIVQFIYFAYLQFKLKKSLKYYLISTIVFGISFLIVSATWYYQNFWSYLAFARETSSGAVAEVTSLGPVFSPITWFRYWSVIALWHWGIVFSGIFIVTCVWALFTKKKDLLLLFLIPLPALIAVTLSLNKTARYFLPAVAFWIILVSVFLLMLWQRKNLLTKFLVIAVFIINGYLFTRTYLSLPKLPYSSYMPSTNKFDNSETSVQRYQFVYEYYQNSDKSPANKKLYNLNEQTRFNDAALIWFFTQRGQEIKTIGEFSPQHTEEQVLSKIEQADILILESNPNVSEKYVEQYKKMREAAALNSSFVNVLSREFADGSTMHIFERVSYLALTVP